MFQPHHIGQGGCGGSGAHRCVIQGILYAARAHPVSWANGIDGVFARCKRQCFNVGGKHLFAPFFAVARILQVFSIVGGHVVAHSRFQQRYGLFTAFRCTHAPQGHALQTARLGGEKVVVAIEPGNYCGVFI